MVTQSSRKRKKKLEEITGIDYDNYYNYYNYDDYTYDKYPRLGKRFQKIATRCLGFSKKECPWDKGRATFSFRTLGPELIRFS